MLHVFLQIRKIIFVHICHFQVQSIKDINSVQLEYEQITVVVSKAHHHLLAGEWHRFGSKLFI